MALLAKRRRENIGTRGQPQAPTAITVLRARLNLDRYARLEGLKQEGMRTFYLGSQADHTLRKGDIVFLDTVAAEETVGPTLVQDVTTFVFSTANGFRPGDRLVFFGVSQENIGPDTKTSTAATIARTGVQTIINTGDTTIYEGERVYAADPVIEDGDGKVLDPNTHWFSAPCDGDSDTRIHFKTQPLRMSNLFGIIHECLQGNAAAARRHRLTSHDHENPLHWLAHPDGRDVANEQLRANEQCLRDFGVCTHQVRQLHDREELVAFATLQYLRQLEDRVIGTCIQTCRKLQPLTIDVGH